jgi:hypothetical protein
MKHDFSGLRPMKDFDPSGPALLHDDLSGRIVTWDWTRSEDFWSLAVVQPDGRVIFEGHLFNGWDDVLGG